MNNRIICLSTPELEELLIQGKHIEEIFSFLIQINKFMTKYNESVVMVLPNEILPYLQSDQKLKTALSILKSKGGQSNIMFASATKKERCRKSSTKEDFGYANAEATSRLILNFIYENKLPVLFGVDNSQHHQVVTKSICTLCHGSELCGLGLEVPVSKLEISKIDEIYSLFNTYFEKIDSAKEFISQDIKNEEKIKYLTFLMCLKNKIKISDIDLMKNYNFHKSFFEDIDQITNGDLKNIAFSAFRKHAFPPLDDNKNAQEFSIDWHKNKPDEAAGIKLFRCDVCEDHQRGKIKSGSKRLLIGQYKGFSMILSYTTKHDFELNESLNKRLQDFKSEVDKASVKKA